MDHHAPLRTVGVEEEFLLVDPAGRPRPMSAELLADRPGGTDGPDATGAGVEHELHQEQAETGTRPRVELSALAADVRLRRRILDKAARGHDVRIAALATSPLPVDPTPTVDERYARIMAEYALTAQEQLTCGCHVHVGVADAEQGAAAVTAIAPWLSVLLALSANSPFWQGEDTGYASYRRMVWDRWPVSGPTGGFADRQEYDKVVTMLVRSGVLLDDGMIYFDARLSARYPTVEIRVPDVCPDPDDAVLIAALCRGLVDTALDGPPSQWPGARMELLRGAAWRAAKSGLDGDLVDPVAGIAVPAAKRVQQLVDLVEPSLRRHGDLDTVEASLHRVLSQGNGAVRQRAVHARTGSLTDVVTDIADLTVPTWT